MPIDESDEGKVISINFVFAKALCPKRDSDDGRKTLVSPLLENESSPTVMSDVENETLSKPAQDSKVLSLNDESEVGSATDVKPVFANAPCPKKVKEVGSRTFESALQYWNVKVPIEISETGSEMLCSPQ